MERELNPAEIMILYWQEYSMVAIATFTLTIFHPGFFFPAVGKPKAVEQVDESN